MSITGFVYRAGAKVDLLHHGQYGAKDAIAEATGVAFGHIVKELFKHVKIRVRDDPLYGPQVEIDAVLIPPDALYEIANTANSTALKSANAKAAACKNSDHPHYDFSQAWDTKMKL